MTIPASPCMPVLGFGYASSQPAVGIPDVLLLNMLQKQTLQVTRITVHGCNGCSDHFLLSDASPENLVAAVLGKLADEFALGSAIALPKRMQGIYLAHVIGRATCKFLAACVTQAHALPG